MSGKKNDTSNPFVQWLLNQQYTHQKTLPLTHITVSKHARDIISSGDLKTSKCKYLKKEVLYCFYGKASYRLTGDNALTSPSPAPSCFVLKGELLEESDDVLPFDSGAYFNSMYKNYMGNEFSLDDFSLAKDSTLPNRVISALYNSFKDYAAGNPDTSVDVNKVSNPDDFEVQSYLNLIRSKFSNKPDDRLSSIEVQFHKNLPIKDNIICIIVPHVLFDTNYSSDWLLRLEKNGVDVRTYEFLQRRKPLEHHALLEQEFRAFCSDNNYYD